MSDADNRRSQQSTQTYPIPSLLTNSGRTLLETFGDAIIQLRATGSVETTNRTTIDDLRDYGVSWEQQDHQRLTIDYEQLPGSDGPANPLDESAREQLLGAVDRRLTPHETTTTPDLAVTQCTLRIADERLQAVTPAQTPEFDLHFVSDPADQPLRAATKRANADRNLYSELGFEVRNLNLRTVVETETKYHQQSDGRYFSWGGPGDIRPRTPERLAVRINDHVLPDQYGLLKPYVVADDHSLELAEGAIDPHPTDDDATRTSTEADPQP